MPVVLTIAAVCFLLLGIVEVRAAWGSFHGSRFFNGGISTVFGLLLLALAALAGTSPVDASSGQQKRHRLNRGGDRQANAG